jgi:K+-transporting ATPase KdpF subunit
VSAIQALLLALSACVFLYLCYAMVKPERF